MDDRSAEPESARARLHKLAADLDATITTMGAACSALMSFLDLGTEPYLPLPDQIHYQVGALEMADELATYLPFIQSSLPRLKNSLLEIQQQATQEATDEENRSKRNGIQRSGTA